MKTFLKGLFLALAGLLFLFPLSPKETKSAWKQIEAFTNEYRIPFQWGSNADFKIPSNYEFQPIDDEDPHYLLECAPFIIGEFRKYPPAFIQGSGLSRVIFINDFKDPRANTVVYGMALLADLTILLNARQMRWNDNESSRILHHEFFHILDQGDTLREYELNKALRVAQGQKALFLPFFIASREEFVNWQKLNPEGFVYPGQRSLPNENWHTMDHPKPGFATLYGLINIMEDRAELFGNLRVPDDAKKIYGFAEDDVYLSNKIGQLRKYLQARHPGMDERFWRGYTNEVPDP